MAGARTSGVFTNNNGLSPLMMAAACKNARFARFLIEEAGAPVYERSPSGGHTALHLCHRTADEMVALLLDAGAAIEARADDGCTPLSMFFHRTSTPTTRLMLDRGASVNVIAKDGSAPLIMACYGDNWLRDEGWPLFQEILRHSSATTRRSRWGGINESAIDLLARLLDLGDPFFAFDPRVQKRCCWVIAELLASGAPVRPDNASCVLPIAASLSARQDAELAARRAELCSWRAHEAFVGLSLDAKELRQAERVAEERRTRVAALERELRQLGGGERDTESSSDGSEGGEDVDESESDSAG